MCCSSFGPLVWRSFQLERIFLFPVNSLMELRRYIQNEESMSNWLGHYVIFKPWPRSYSCALLYARGLNIIQTVRLLLSHKSSSVFHALLGPYAQTHIHYFLTVRGSRGLTVLAWSHPHFFKLRTVPIKAYL